MAREKIGFDTVRKLASELSGVEDATAYGSPALKVRGKMFACTPTNKSAEPGSLLVRIDFERRAELLATAPEVYYLPDHYVNYPSVLVRYARIHPDALRDLVGMAYRYVTAPGRKGKRP